MRLHAAAATMQPDLGGSMVSLDGKASESTNTFVQEDLWGGSSRYEHKWLQLDSHFHDTYRPGTLHPRAASVLRCSSSGGEAVWGNVVGLDYAWSAESWWWSLGTTTSLPLLKPARRPSFATILAERGGFNAATF